MRAPADRAAPYWLRAGKAGASLHSTQHTWPHARTAPPRPAHRTQQYTPQHAHTYTAARTPRAPRTAREAASSARTAAAARCPPAEPRRWAQRAPVIRPRRACQTPSIVSGTPCPSRNTVPLTIPPPPARALSSVPVSHSSSGCSGSLLVSLAECPPSKFPHPDR
jgi:hypothetical protein